MVRVQTTDGSRVLWGFKDAIIEERNPRWLESKMARLTIVLLARETGKGGIDYITSLTSEETSLGCPPK